jgi:hypothetical protein
MRPVTADIARAIERLKTDSNDFDLFIEWLEMSFREKISEMLRMDKNTIQIGQGYSQALDDIISKVASSRETLDRSNKNRDTR